MKAILVNGSPKQEGSTNGALRVVAENLQRQGIETDIHWIGNKPMQCCIGCNACRRKDGTGGCAIASDVNEFAQKMELADALIVGSPVYFANCAGALSGWLDRLFYAHSHKFRGKLASSVAVCRRGGGTATIDQMNKYFGFAEMPIVSSQYWNVIHGNHPDEIKQDAEGMQILKVLADNMSFLLQCLDAGKKAGIQMPPKDKRQWTNFIRN